MPALDFSDQSEAVQKPDFTDQSEPVDASQSSPIDINSLEGRAALTADAPQSVLGAYASEFKDLGAGVGLPGKVTRAALADAAAYPFTAKDESPIANVKAAVAGDRELPIDTTMAAKSTPTAVRLGYDVSGSLEETAPKLLALPLAGESLLAQGAAAGGLFGFDSEGNFSPKLAIVGAFMPGVSKSASKLAGMAIAKGIEAGATSLENPLAQKTVEAIANQAALNAYMAAADSPELIKQYQDDPEQFKKSLFSMVGQNLAFGLIGATHEFKPSVESATQKFINNYAVKSALDLSDSDYANQFWNKVNAKQSTPINPITGKAWSLNLKTQPTGEPNAETIRGNQEVLPTPGGVNQTSESNSGGNVEQKSSGQPEPLEPGEENQVQNAPVIAQPNPPLTAEQTAIIRPKLEENIGGRNVVLTPQEFTDPHNSHLNHVLGKGAPTWQQLADSGIVTATPADNGAVEIKLTPSNLGGAQENLPAAEQAISKANNSREAFLKANGGVLPTPETTAVSSPAPIIDSQDILGRLAKDSTGQNEVTSTGQAFALSASYTLDGIKKALGLSGNDAVTALRKSGLLIQDDQGNYALNHEFYPTEVANAKKLAPPVVEKTPGNVFQPPVEATATQTEPVVPVDETKPAIPETIPPVIETPAPEQRYRLRKDPHTVTIVERLPQSAAEKISDEHPVRIKYDQSGEVQTVMEHDLTPVKTRTTEEKTGKTKRDLDKELIAAKLDPSAFQNDAQKREALKRAKRKGQIELNEGEPIAETSARGIEGIREMFNRDDIGLDPKTRAVWQAFLNVPALKGLDWNNFEVEMRQRIEYGLAGAHTLGLVELSANSSPQTFPHEMFHELQRLLPLEISDALNDLRLAELKSRLGDNIPPELVHGTMTTNQFLESGLPRELYPLINPDEYLANFAGKKFSEEDYQKFLKQPEGFLQNAHAQIQKWIRALVNTYRRIVRTRPDLQSVYEDLLNGRWQPTPESGAAYERSGSLPKTPEALLRKQTFDEPGAMEGVAGSYGTFTGIKRAAADAVNANDRVRALLNLPRQEVMAGIARTATRGLDNYYDVMQQVANGPPALKTEVALNAYHLAAYEQVRAINMEKAYNDQHALIFSDAFKRKLERLDVKQVNMEALQGAKDTFLNQIGQEAGGIIRQLNEKGATEAQYEQMRSDLERIRQLPKFSERVANMTQDIVDMLSASQHGLEMLYQSTSKSGDGIYRAYMDMMESITERPKASMAAQVDPEFLSPEDRAKLEASRKPILSNDQKAFAQLASQVLAANRELSRQLSILSFFKADPMFQQKVTDVGKQFAAQLAKDPVAAINTLVNRAAKLGEKTANAEAAWMTLNKKVTKEIEEFSNLRQATQIEKGIQQTPEWQKLITDIYKNASNGVRFPDVVLKQMDAEHRRALAVQKGDASPRTEQIFNEFTSNPQFVGPSGNVHQIDLGFTKADAVKSFDNTTSYLGEIDSWLNDPANKTSPDRAYWQDRQDFIESVYLTSAINQPTSTLPLGVQHSFYVPDYLFDQLALPQAKVARIAFENLNSAYAKTTGWQQDNQSRLIESLALASKSHNIPVRGGLQQYQEQVLNQMGYLSRAGKRMTVGYVLDNGIVLNSRDITAFKQQGKASYDLANLVKNTGREQVMPDRQLLDEFGANLFGVRGPMELGGEAHTTLPHQFSQRGRDLSQTVTTQAEKGATPDQIASILNQQNNFDFVRYFISQRKSSFVKSLSPFEDIYKSLADEQRNGNGPQTLDEVIDYITSNSTADWPRDKVKVQVMGEMQDRLKNFYDKFIRANADPTDLRVQRTNAANALTRGFVDDVENSFFYDYGMANDADVRSLATDANNYHVVRIDYALESLAKEMNAALNDLRNAERNKDEGFRQRQRQKFFSGDDFRDYDRLESQLREVMMFRKTMPSWVGVKTPEAALLSKGTRIVGDIINSRLTGGQTSLRILLGSIFKMGTVFAASDHGMMLSYPKAVASMAYSAFRVGIPSVAGGVARVARNIPETVRSIGETKEGANAKFAVAVRTLLQGITEDVMRPTKFLRDQHDVGLVPDQLLGHYISNMLMMPQSRGHGFDPKQKTLALPRRIANGILTSVEVPVELLRSYFPQLAYNVAYDAAARQAGWTLDTLEASARRAFQVREKLGTLGQYDLANPSNPKNQLIANEVLPRSLVPKTQTSLNLTRDWFRAIDLPYNEAVLNFWKKLSETPEADRGKVRMLGSDIADSQAASEKAERRAVALMAVSLRDVHHAAPSNRPWIMRSVPFLRIINPFVGWSTQSTRQMFSLLGTASSDPKNSRAMLWAATIASTLGAVSFAVLNGETDNRAAGLFRRWILGKSDNLKHLSTDNTASQNMAVAASDATAYISLIHTAVNSMLGLDSSRGGMNFKPMLLDEADGWLQLANGMIHTKDLGYGVNPFLAREIPALAPALNRLPGQEGLTEKSGVTGILSAHAPPDLARRPFSGDIPVPTELSPIKNQFANAIYKGDVAGAQAAYQAFIAKATEIGRKDPAALAAQMVSSLNPYQQAFGQKLTDQQRTDLLASLSPDELARVTAAEGNWQKIEQQLGRGQGSITKLPAGGSGSSFGGSVGGSRISGSSRTSNRIRGRGPTQRSGSGIRSVRVSKLRASSGGRVRSGSRNRIRSHKRKSFV